MSRAPKLRIVLREFGAVVIRRGRVVFKSTATDARFECARFAAAWTEEAANSAPIQPRQLAEIVQW